MDKESRPMHVTNMLFKLSDGRRVKIEQALEHLITLELHILKAINVKFTQVLSPRCLNTPSHLTAHITRAMSPLTIPATHAWRHSFWTLARVQVPRLPASQAEVKEPLGWEAKKVLEEPRRGPVDTLLTPHNKHDLDERESSQCSNCETSDLHITCVRKTLICCATSGGGIKRKYSIELSQSWGTPAACKACWGN